MDNKNDGRDKKHVMGYHLICSLSCDEEDGCGNRFGSMSEKEPERGSEEDLCTWRRGDFCGWPSLPRTTQVLIDFRSGRAIPRLREGRPLYGSSAHMSHSLSRWPRECQVIPEEIHHIEWVPPVPELFCGQMNPDERVQVPEEQDGIVVYDAGGVKERFFSGSCLGGRRAPLEDVAVSLAGPDDTTLLFEARFESGNLQRALRVGEYDYDLTLRTDLYTNRHTQWFYFRVKNTRAHVPYRFTISNLLKESNLFKQGQRPLLYSEEKARTQRVGWHRAGQDVTYHRNGCQHAGRPCHSLSWTLSFPYNRDTCYLALCYPYTYSNLRAHLSEIEGDPERSRFCKVRTLCRSLAGNLVPVLTITNPSQWEEEGGVARKPAVVLTARVHPGETNSSWVMKGVVDFLLGTSSKAALLRDSFLFKLVPMLNPDGVIVGNCRCSLAGHDLNRSYNSVFRDCFPSVVSVRAMTQRLCEERMVLMYCDFHGHSRRQNAFAYGCESPRLGQKHSRARVFPLMLSKNCPDMFSFQSCKFKVQRSKEGTGRVALWRLGVLNSFTLETSLCGSDMGRRKGTHFNTHDLQMLGVHFCDTLLDFCDPNKTKYSFCVRELQELMREEESPPTEPQPQARDSDTEALTSQHRASSSGSSSSESEGPSAPFQALNQRTSCKKHLKSRKEQNGSLDLNDKISVREMKGVGCKDTLEKSKYELKPLKVPPGLQKRWLSEWRCIRSNLPEASISDKKAGGAGALQSDCLEHLMSEYLRRRVQQGLGQALIAPLMQHLGLSHLPKVQLSMPSRLPALPALTAEDRTIGQLADWPKAHTAPASLEIRSNRLEPLCLQSLNDHVHGGTSTCCPPKENDIKYAKKKKWKIADEIQTQERRKPFDSNILKTAKKTHAKTLPSDVK